MKRTPFTVFAALSCLLITSTACQRDEPVDLTPLPTVAAPPYLCDYIPQRAVELMTGVRNPLVRGYFDLAISDGIGDGSCTVYQRDGDRLKVLVIDLSPGGYPGLVEGPLSNGATPLPEIVPGAIGAYFKGSSGENNTAFARLVRGKAELGIRLEIGVEGRDNAADVAALMKLIAPKLITDASAPSPSPSPTPSASKGD
jgi:hypothetical protein